LSCGNNFAFRGIKLAAAALGLAFASQVSISRAEDKKSSACNEDAMIVFDANAALPVMSAVMRSFRLVKRHSRQRVGRARLALQPYEFR